MKGEDGGVGEDWRNNGWNVPTFDENFINPQILELRHKKITNKMTPRHITIKLLKTNDKNKTLNAARGKRYIIYKRIKISV